MIRYVIKRLLAAVLTLFAISVTTFAFFFLGPANPAAGMCGARVCPPERIAVINHWLELDQPVLTQYSHYMSGLFVGRTVGTGPDAIRCDAPCFGLNFRSNEPVSATLARGLPITVSLAAGTAVVSVLIGVGLGVVSALRQGGWIDKFSIGFTLVGASTQSFFLGLLLQGVFVYQLGWLPRAEYVSPMVSPGRWFAGMFLPWLTLGLLNAAIFARLARSEMVELLPEDFVRTARAKGVKSRRISVRHVLRAGLSPILTLLGIQLGGTLGGFVIAEAVFGMNGLGRLAVTAADQQNLPVIMAVVLIGAVFVVLVNLATDLVYSVLDPRVRTG
ncbi:ABC transporter permease [Longispora urticae]